MITETKYCSECNMELIKRRTEPKETFKERTVCSVECKWIKIKRENYAKRQAAINSAPAATMQSAISAPFVR